MVALKALVPFQVASFSLKNICPIVTLEDPAYRVTIWTWIT